MSKTIIIIGRGHSGSRAIAQFLSDNGFFMGKELNNTLDKKPFDVLWNLGEKTIKHFNFTKPEFKLKIKSEFPDGFAEAALKEYLNDILINDSPFKGVKCASLAYAYEFLVKYYPDFYYLHWTRSISKKNEHERGDLGDKKLAQWGLQINDPSAAWKVYYDIVKRVPQPKNFLHMRFEDFVLSHDKSANKLEKWLDIKLPHRYKVLPKCIENYISKGAEYYLLSGNVFPNDHGNLKHEWLRKPMEDLGYINGN